MCKIGWGGEILKQRYYLGPSAQWVGEGGSGVLKGGATGGWHLAISRRFQTGALIYVKPPGRKIKL